MVAPDAPRLLSVEYVPGSPWSLAVRFEASEIPGRIFATQVFLDAALTETFGGPVGCDGATSGSWDEHSARCTLDPGTPYWIALVLEHGNPNVISNGLPVLWRTPSVTAVACGTESLDVAWAPTGAPAPVTAQVRLTAGGAVVWLSPPVVAAPSATAGLVSRCDVSAAPLALAPAAVDLSLRQVVDDAGAVSYGPWATAAARTHAPVVVAAAYTGGDTTTGLRYDVTLAPLGTGAGDDVAVALLAGGAPYGPPVDATLSGTTVAVTVPPGTFGGHTLVPPGTPLAVTVASRAGVATGPWSEPFPLLAAPPVVEAATYADGVLAVELDAPTGATLLTLTGTSTVTSVVEGERGTVALAAGTYDLTAAALSAGATGVPSASLPLVTTSPALLSASYDGATVRAAWSGSGAAAYRVTVRAGDAPVATVSVGATEAALDVAAEGTLTVDVTGVTGVAQGPPSEPLTLVTTAPEVRSVTTSPLTRATTVTWDEVPGATSYVLQRFRYGIAVGAPVSADGTSAVVPVGPDVEDDLAVAAVVTAGSTTVTGPYGTPYPLPAAVPAVTDVAFDGTYATVYWEPVGGVTGYVATAVAVPPGGVATVVGSGTAAAGETSMTFAVDSPDASPDVAVQVLVAGDTGPLTDWLPLAPEAWYLSTEPATTTYPYVFTSAGIHLTPVVPTVVPLTSLGASFAGPVTSGAFAIGADGKTLTISAGAPTTQDAIRDTLREEYSSLLVAAESAGADAAGVALLQQAVSRSMPQTFVETLYYAYGLDPNAGFADLRPGMVVRVSFTGWDNTGQPTPPRFVNGWSGTGSVDYDVTTWGNAANARLTGLDAFLAPLVATGALTVNAPGQSGSLVSAMGDAADLFGLGVPPVYLRLFAPTVLAAPDAIGTSSPTTEFAVAAARTWQDVERAARVPQAGIPVVGFRGRAVVRLCHRVVLDGNDVVVPIGTTVGALLDRYAARPPRGAARSTSVVLDRAAGPIPVDGTYDAAATRRVHLDWCGVPSYGAGLDAFSLPLLAGDRVSVVS